MTVWGGDGVVMAAGCACVIIKPSLTSPDLIFAVANIYHRPFGR
jgi:hypothetical protein